MTTGAYEIVIRGRASSRFLRPLLDEFVIHHDTDGATRLTGDVRDAAHLHGIVAHLTSVGAELISIGPVPSSEPADDHHADFSTSAANPRSNRT